MLILIGFIILGMLFVFSAFWSGAETALTSLSKYRVRKLITLNKSLSATLGEWLKTPYYLLTMILVGNTVNDLLLSYLATVLVIEVFKPLLLVIPREAIEFIAWIIVTFVLLVFGEITPKIYSRRNPEKVTLLALPLLSRLMRISGVLISPFTKSVKLLFPTANLVPVGRLTYISLEEIKGLISEADTGGVFGKETSQMLERVLRLGDLNVSQIMTPVEKIEGVNLYQDEEKFLDLLVETGRSRVPVYNSTINRVAGFIHTKDLLKCSRSKHGCNAREIIRPPYFVPVDKKVYDLLKEFQAGKTHMAFVIDGIGNVVGLVTLEDVLEDIVGEILDEYDVKKIK